MQALHQALLRQGVARRDDDAARAAVQPVDGPEEEGRAALVGGHEVGQRAQGLAARGERGHGRGLVHEEQILVGVEHAQRARLRDDALVVGALADRAEHLARAHDAVGIDGRAIQEDALCALEGADLPVGHAQQRLERLVRAQAVAGGGDGQEEGFLPLHQLSSTLEYWAIMLTISWEGSMSSSVRLPSRTK